MAVDVVLGELECNIAKKLEIDNERRRAIQRFTLKIVTRVWHAQGGVHLS